jgi:hypothetical protein
VKPNAAWQLANFSPSIATVAISPVRNITTCDCRQTLIYRRFISQ